MFANIKNLKIVDDGYLDFRDYGTEKEKYDGKIEDSLKNINQGIVFEPNSAKSVHNFFFSVDDDNIYR